MCKLTILTRILLLASFLHLTACSTVGYIGHTASGHLGLMQKRQAITKLVEDQSVDLKQRKKLNNALRIREFASNTLNLPNNKSYTSYVDLQRDYVTWVVFAAPSLSLQAETWCFFIVGCVPYRGYFDIQKAERFAEQLKDEGLEVYIAPVPAYSTLGWFSDPLLSSMLNRGEVVTAEYIFHELAHQKVYIKNDSGFNEAFASAVGRLGVMAWLQAEEKSEVLDRYVKRIKEKEVLYRDIDHLRKNLAMIYDSSLSDKEKQAKKNTALTSYKKSITEKINTWGVFDVYESWLLKDINNAKLNALSTYQALIPEFVQLFNRCDKDFARFYKAVESLEKVAKDERVSSLARIACS